MPSSQGPQDEQKESFFLQGKARESTLDFKGATEAFEKALEVNPQNASAHFELGLLYEKDSDFSAAIYHFERYLKLRPESDRSQLVKDRIMQDKMELSKTTTFAPVTQNLQKEFEKLAAENKDLRAQVETLQTQLAASQQQLATRQTRVADPTISDNTRPQPGTLVDTRTSQQSNRTTSSNESRPTTRVHTVKAGDTPSSIARTYGVKLDALMALNPTLDPRRMKVGQTVRIPPQ